MGKRDGFVILYGMHITDLETLRRNQRKSPEERGLIPKIDRKAEEKELICLIRKLLQK
jgi:hypothetical protein